MTTRNEKFTNALAAIGWSQERLAEVIDVRSVSTVENWAAGASRVNGAAQAIIDLVLERPEMRHWFEARRPRSARPAREPAQRETTDAD